MYRDAVLKKIPEDFLVRENLVVELVPRGAANQCYLLLRKRGYTTMEAIRVIADRAGVDSREISYGGLKDEDGVTEQLVAVPIRVAPDAGATEWTVVAEGGRWITLALYGYGTTALEIGGLEGNGFQIVLRDLDEKCALRLRDAGKIPLLFLNYYDTQRFGVPGGPKQTHLVGAAIREQDWEEARRILVGLCAPESALAESWTGTSEAFFADLDPRTVSFYLAALASWDWNAELNDLVRAHCGLDWAKVGLEGIEYCYPTSPQAVMRVMMAARELPYTRYSFADGVAVSQNSARLTAVQTVVSVGVPTPDEFFAGRHRVTVRFLLPSGCYATAVIRQLLVQL